MKKIVCFGIYTVFFLFSKGVMAQTHASLKDSNKKEKESPITSLKRSEATFEDIKVFPNPSVHEFTIDAAEDFHIKVFDNLGQVVEEFKASSGKKSFGQELLPGVYHLNFFKEGKIIKTMNVVKNW